LAQFIVQQAVDR